jgi:hypothetical protein
MKVCNLFIQPLLRNRKKLSPEIHISLLAKVSDNP